MRARILALIAGLATGSAAMSAQATPVAPVPGPDSKQGIIQVWGGCGWGFHPNRWGHCIPNRWGYYRPYRPYWRHHYYYGSGYYPYWRRHYWYGY
jgi:hypothetical protein